MASFSRRDFIFLVLTGFFVTNAIVAELIGGKLIEMGPWIMSIGVLPWPVVFLTTDLINEYFGKAEADRLIEQAAQESVRAGSGSTCDDT